MVTQNVQEAYTGSGNDGIDQDSARNSTLSP